MARPSQTRTIVSAVLATLAIVAGGWFAWSLFTDHRNSEKTAEVSAWTQQSMQQTLSTDDKFRQYGIRVLTIDLIRVSDTKYEGIATVRTAKSATERQVQIDVTADGERMMWQAAPGAFLFLVQDAIGAPS